MLTSRKNDNSVSFNLIKEAGIRILKTYDLTSHLLSPQTVCINVEVGVGKKAVCIMFHRTQRLALLGLILPKQDVYKCLEMFLIVTVRWKMLLSWGRRGRARTAKQPTMCGHPPQPTWCSRCQQYASSVPDPNYLVLEVSVTHFRLKEALEYPCTMEISWG